MNKNTFLKITLASTIGLLITGAALTTMTWLQRTIGPSLNAVDLWLALRSSINSSEVLANSARQQSIYSWLSVIIGSYVLQLFATITIVNWRKVIGWGISLALWLVMFIADSILILRFNAVISGAMWLGFGCIVAIAGELWIILNELTLKRYDLLKEMSSVAERWNAIVPRAIKEKQSFAILAIRNSPQLSFEELQKLQIELRGRDQIYAAQDGIYVLLWQITPDHTPIMANKLSKDIQGHSSRDVQIGYACYPADGSDIQTLLSHALQALKSAQLVGGQAIIPFSSPASKNTHGALAPWEGLLEEAANSKIPVTTIFFKTDHPLSLSENYLIQKELRGRDMVTVFENGFYVFLWNTTSEGGQIVLAKLTSILASENIENQSVMALFPDDGKTLADIIGALEVKSH